MTWSSIRPTTFGRFLFEGLFYLCVYYFTGSCLFTLLKLLRCTNKNKWTSCCITENNLTSWLSTILLFFPLFLSIVVLINECVYCTEHWTSRTAVRQDTRSAVRSSYWWKYWVDSTDDGGGILRQSGFCLAWHAIVRCCGFTDRVRTRFASETCQRLVSISSLRCADMNEWHHGTESRSLAWIEWSGQTNRNIISTWSSTIKFNNSVRCGITFTDSIMLSSSLWW